MYHTFLWSFDQLDRAQDRELQSPLRIFSVILDDQSWEDQYIVLVDCSEKEALILHLL